MGEKSGAEAEANLSVRDKQFLDIVDARFAKNLTAMDTKFAESVTAMKAEWLAAIKTDVQRAVEAMGTVEGRVHVLEDDRDAIREDIAQLNQELEEQRENNAQLRKQVLEAQHHAIRNEQYTRRTSVRVFGLTEAEDEDVTAAVLAVFTEKLELVVGRSQIEACHRVGPAPQRVEDDEDPPRPRGVLVKMTRREQKEKIIKQRKKLKGSGVVIVEDLCPALQRVYNRVRKHPKVESCWTWQGAIYAKVGHQQHKIQYGEQLPF
jgi:chromosome segregation ATPase